MTTPSCRPARKLMCASSTETADTVTGFGQRHQVQANAVALANWDYKKLAATAGITSISQRIN